MDSVAKAAIGTGEAAKHFTESLSSPLSLVTMGAGGAIAKAYPMVSRALSGAFGALMAKQAADEVGELVNLPPEQRDAKTVAQKVASIVLTGGSAAVAGYDAMLKSHPETTPAKAAERAGVPPEVHDILEKTAGTLPLSTAEVVNTHTEKGKSNEEINPSNENVQRSAVPEPAKEKSAAPGPDAKGATTGTASKVDEPKVSQVNTWALQSQREAGWNPKWPFVPIDFANKSFRDAIES